jgi:hypothetical protein
MRKVVIIGTGLLVTFVVVVSLFFHFNPLCGEDVLSEETSPDGRYIAVLMQRGCGATTPFVEHINLRAAGSNLHPDFFDGTITQGEVFTLGRKHEGRVRFEWLGPRRLEIIYPDSEQSFNHKDVWQDVHVDYQHK